VTAGRDDGLEPRAVPGKGRGVFARHPFAAGSLLLLCPTIELTPADCAEVDRTAALHKHYFTHPEIDGGGLLALGLLTLANHSPDPNADWDYRADAGLGWVIGLTALRDLAAGEEVTIDYNCALWFDPTP
jgi:hypothetical protein